MDNTSHIDWSGHTLDSLRELCKEYQQRWWNASADAQAAAFIGEVHRTPQAWRIFGAVVHCLERGYDADHIIRWLDAGLKAVQHNDRPD